MKALLEKQILQYGLILGIVYQFYQSMLSLFPHPQLQLALVNVLITLFLIFLYVLAQKRTHVQFITFVLHLLALSGFAYFWIEHGGLAGTVPSFLCLYISFIVISSHGIYRAVGLALLIGMVCCFLWAPSWLGMAGVNGRLTMTFAQQTVDYLIIAGLIALFALYVRKNFTTYRSKAANRYEQLRKIMRTLLEQNRELATREEETRAINDNLEALVRERTREVEAQNKALAEYAFINAHMLRGPVCRIIGLLQLMEHSAEKYPAGQVQRMKAVAEQLDEQIRKINQVVS
jgi:signal transduction histidine kinase